MLLPPTFDTNGADGRCCHPIVAALCATGVEVYADGDRLVATVRWQHGCSYLGRRPLGLCKTEFILSRRASCIALARSASALA